jgi:hypothetical protein
VVFWLGDWEGAKNPFSSRTIMIPNMTQELKERKKFEIIEVDGRIPW